MIFGMVGISLFAVSALFAWRAYISATKAQTPMSVYPKRDLNMAFTAYGLIIIGDLFVASEFIIFFSP